MWWQCESFLCVKPNGTFLPKSCVFSFHLSYELSRKIVGNRYVILFFWSDVCEQSKKKVLIWWNHLWGKRGLRWMKMICEIVWSMHYVIFFPFSIRLLSFHLKSWKLCKHKTGKNKCEWSEVWNLRTDKIALMICWCCAPPPMYHP